MDCKLIRVHKGKSFKTDRKRHFLLFLNPHLMFLKCSTVFGSLWYSEWKRE